MPETVEAAFAAGARLWLLSDLHANGPAVAAAVRRLPPGEPVVILGDLLTYGADPAPVLDAVAALLADRPSALLLGNHDQLYRDLARDGGAAYYDRLPAFVRESVDWTLPRLDLSRFDEGWPWRERLVLGDVLVDHANPGPYGDWSYVDGQAQHEAALAAAKAEGFRLAVLGHVHRPKLLHATAGGRRTFDEDPIVEDRRLAPGDGAVWNVGSVGQPRHRTAASTFGVLQRQGDGLHLRHLVLDYDRDAHRARVRAAGLTEATTARLLSYFEVTA